MLLLQMGAGCCVSIAVCISLIETLRKWLQEPAIHLHVGSRGSNNSSVVGSCLEDFPNGDTRFSGSYSEQI